jgi:ABC-type Zn uptake system ZnuABC Zn-binding protein ZnuA
MLFIHPCSAEEDTINIVCTNAVLADFTSNIMVDNVSIEYIMPAGACPAHFDTTPSDVLKIVNADIIISLGWEPWLENLLNKSGNTQYTELPISGLGEWNIPSGAIQYVQTISNGLQQSFPEINRTIQKNTEEYLAKIDETSEQLQDQITSFQIDQRKIICMEWQKDFLEWLGLNVTYFYGPPEGLSVQDELDVISAALKEDVSAVIDNLQSGTEFGANVAGESGISHIIFTNFPGALPNTDTYLEMITYNTDQLIKGINTFDHTSDQTREIQDELNTMEFQRNLLAVTTLIMFVLCGVLCILYKRK